MKKISALFSLFLVVALIAAVSVGCTNGGNTDLEASPSVSADPSDEAVEDTGFDYSEGITEDGLWADVAALDYVELCAYTGISVPSDVHEITDESVQAEIDTVLMDYTTEEQVTDRAIEDGDTVNIDYVGSVDGVEFEGGNTGGQGTEVTIGVTQYIDDFLEQLIGHTPGESFDIEVTFPEDYGVEDLNGKDAVFAITVNHIIETINPEMTDDFVAENLSEANGWNTVAEMEEGIRSDLQRSAVTGYVQDYIVDNTSVTSVPDGMIAYQQNSLIDFYQGYAEYYGVDLDVFLSEYMELENTDALLQEYSDENTQKATVYLIMQAIAEDAGIAVADADVAAYFSKYMGTEDYTEHEGIYGMPYIKLMVLHQTVLDYLADNAVME